MKTRRRTKNLAHPEMIFLHNIVVAGSALYSACAIFDVIVMKLTFNLMENFENLGLAFADQVLVDTLCSLY